MKCVSYYSIGTAEREVLITCDKKNEASRKTIVKNGGVLESEILDTAGLSESGIIQLYWISIIQEMTLFYESIFMRWWFR